MNNLKEKLINTAHAKGICAEGYKRMLCSSDIDAMINYYVDNPEWCMERDFPTLPMLRNHFADISNKGVYIDHTFNGEMLNDLQTYIFHNCNGTINVGLNVDKAIIPMLYLANRCDLKIVGVGDIKPIKPSEVPVYVFGYNEVNATNNEYVKFVIYKQELL